MKCFSRECQSNSSTLPPFYMLTVIQLYKLFTARAHALAAGRIFLCKVQSSAVDAENFWEEGRIAAVVPMTGIFLSLAPKRIPAKKFAS